MIIDVFVDRFETDDFTKQQYFLIEPHSYFIETHPVVMASCLVDIRNELTNKNRLMNPFDYEIPVNQNTVVGEAEKVESQPTTLFTVEDSGEIKNFNPTRRIKLGESKPETLALLEIYPRKEPQMGEKWCSSKPFDQLV
jgi:hypothetical protein